MNATSLDELVERVDQLLTRTPRRWVDMLERIIEQIADTMPDSEVEIVVIETDHLGAVTKSRHRVPVIWDYEVEPTDQVRP